MDESPECDLCGAEAKKDLSVCYPCFELLDLERKMDRLDLLIAGSLGAVAGFVIALVLMALL